MGTAVMVTSGKGGTGKTTLTSAIAACLAALGKRVLCIDMDIALRNLDMALGLSDMALMDFSDVMESRCPLLTAAVEHPEIRGLFLLNAPMSLERPDEEAFCQMVYEAKECFDYVFLDSPAGLGTGFQLSSAAAGRAIVVSTTEPATLRDAQKAVTELSGQIKDLHLVMNRVQPKLIRKLRTSVDAAMDAAGLPLLGVVPEDKAVALAAGEGIPLVLYAHKGAAAACLNIAKRLMGEKVPLLRIR